MTRRFYKMTGSGNDFVFLDGRSHSLADWPEDRIRSVCDRRMGVGADGIVHLAPGEQGGVRMRYYNADGSHAEMCGNAALCAARLAVALGLAGPEAMALETDSGRLEGRCLGSGWSAELCFPTAEIPIPSDLPLVDGERLALQGTVGVPHTIVLVDDLDRTDVVGRGRRVRFDPAFAPAGSNVNFIGRIESADAGWALRTYERGVEAETLACGTGTIAAALGLAQAGLTELPVAIRSASGGVFTVSGVLGETEAREVWLRGEGRLVYVGELAD